MKSGKDHPENPPVVKIIHMCGVLVWTHRVECALLVNLVLNWKKYSGVLFLCFDRTRLYSDTQTLFEYYLAV